MYDVVSYYSFAYLSCIYNVYVFYVCFVYMFVLFVFVSSLSFLMYGRGTKHDNPMNGLKKKQIKKYISSDVDLGGGFGT